MPSFRPLPSLPPPPRLATRRRRRRLRPPGQSYRSRTNSFSNAAAATKRERERKEQAGDTKKECSFFFLLLYKAIDTATFFCRHFGAWLGCCCCSNKVSNFKGGGARQQRGNRVLIRLETGPLGSGPCTDGRRRRRRILTFSDDFCLRTGCRRRPPLRPSMKHDHKTKGKASPSEPIISLVFSGPR